MSVKKKTGNCVFVGNYSGDEFVFCRKKYRSVCRKHCR